MKNKTSQFDSKSQTPPPATHDTTVFNLDDFTDYVAFHRKCDITEHGPSELDEKMSQKKCRFCD